jgi:hypothetical protein
MILASEGTRRKQCFASTVLVAVVGLLVAALAAQAPPPSPELNKLEALLGIWTYDVDAPASVFGPAGKLTGTERVEWLPGGRFVEITRDGKAPQGAVRHRLVLGYDPVAKTHTAKWFDLTGGGAGSSTFAVSGTTWNWRGSGTTSDGKPFQERCTFVFPGDGTHSRKCEASPDGRTWSPSFSGTYTKAK